MSPEEYERQDIEVLYEVRPYCFESDREEQWFKVGLQYGLDAADKEPLIHWISVDDDLPCNHEELILYGTTTKKVMVVDHEGCIGLNKMEKRCNGIIGVEPWWQWAIPAAIYYWMPIPELPKE